MWIDLNKVRYWLFSYKHVLNTFVLLTIPLLNNINADVCFYFKQRTKAIMAPFNCWDTNKTFI